jgi:hypothetical protein
MAELPVKPFLQHWLLICSHGYHRLCGLAGRLAVEFLLFDQVLRADLKKRINRLSSIFDPDHSDLVNGPFGAAKGLFTRTIKLCRATPIRNNRIVVAQQGYKCSWKYPFT